MADYFTEVTVMPYIPKDLLSEQDLEMLALFGFQSEQVKTDEGEFVYLYAEEYSGTAFRTVEKGDATEEEELTEADLTAFFRRVIDASNGRLKYLYLQAACTCSKMRPDGFGGWVSFLTKDGERFASTFDAVTKFKAREDRKGGADGKEHEGVGVVPA
jgi:hypothetical protein